MTYSEEKYNALLAVCNSYKNDYDSAFERLKAQQREIDRLKAEFKQLETNAEILARGVRDLNHENYELTEKIKQAKIDVLNELKKKIHDTRLNDDTAEIIIEMIEELTKCRR